MAPRPAIKLNGVVLPPQMIAAEAQHHPAKNPAMAFEAAARALIIRTLLLEEAARQNIVAEPELTAPGKRELDDEARIRALVEASAPIDEPDEAACRAFYDKHQARFRGSDLFEASHILFAAHPHDVEAYAQAATYAEEVIAELAQAPRKFEAIARERSECDSKANGGRLGQIVSGQTVPEFESVLHSLDEGTIAATPVKSRFGAHVLRLDARALGEVLPFDYVREHIVTLIAERTWRRDMTRLVETLLARAEVEGIVMAPPRDQEAA
tara:strand:- start:1191 stop:1994 length:804 start_codon:yes stop_codon:yes gene_type:complete